ncbi:hypothetical protein ACFPOD_01080 [Nitratireductor kimnyeongensis]|uniref:Transposase n=1 Tax=Nitratireductor kimnyeongensis TaxID=430679 RepID=A0ABW0T4G1_9HYPH|nr:hypothetical protein [Nitratireductor kimnyeongensis]
MKRGHAEQLRRYVRVDATKADWRAIADGAYRHSLSSALLGRRD